MYDTGLVLCAYTFNAINVIVTYRPTARQRFDKHIPAETDSWQTARC
jgi:hypothetical protein